jgi:hypothetical protein
VPESASAWIEFPAFASHVVALPVAAEIAAMRLRGWPPTVENSPPT